MSSDGNEIGTGSPLAPRSSSLAPKTPGKIDKSLAVKSTKEMNQSAARNPIRSFSRELSEFPDKIISNTDDNDEQEKEEEVEVTLAINESEVYVYSVQPVVQKTIPSFSRRGKRSDCIQKPPRRSDSIQKSPRRSDSIPKPPFSKLSEKPNKKQEARGRQKARQIYREALHNTSNTITVVAILIATFTYNAGFNPPGGLHQDGPLIGTPVAAKKTAFKVFSVCNNLALFMSLCVVLFLVSIIPFKRKALMRMLAVAHKAVWVAVSFMAASYVAAAMVIMKPQAPRRGMKWATVFVLCLCVGSLGSAIIGLGIMLVKHRLRKREWRKKRHRRKKREWRLKRANAAVRGEDGHSDQEDESSSSTNSDIYISHDKGYYSY
ncbi:hypothetical protein CDL12_06355 [Handroanthus impetiginosus]|uniref:PGG domain-containing protein n=1 Tax=Handroanthus impetiginosus TaxID=429701 RepID=A0A2G9HUG2_9LAMI|nr:hypothetical protein CDL12_06355 [Handroanthus impetiginosus]